MAKQKEQQKEISEVSEVMKITWMVQIERHLRTLMGEKKAAPIIQQITEAVSI